MRHKQLWVPNKDARFHIFESFIELDDLLNPFEEEENLPLPRQQSPRLSEERQDG